MNRLALALILLAVPASAQDEGRGLVERGAETMMRELLREMVPAIRDLEGTLGLLDGVLGEIGEYEAPKVLPNGDIIIRRKREPNPEPRPEEEIEL